MKNVIILIITIIIILLVGIIIRVMMVEQNSFVCSKKMSTIEHKNYISALEEEFLLSTKTLELQGQYFKKDNLKPIGQTFTKEMNKLNTKEQCIGVTKKRIVLYKDLIRELEIRLKQK